MSFQPVKENCVSFDSRHKEAVQNFASWERLVFSSAPKTEHYGGLNVKLLELTIVIDINTRKWFFDACERQRFNIMTTVKVCLRIKFRLMELSPIPFDHLIFEKIWHENINYVCSMF